jgi:hypothetical protein
MVKRSKTITHTVGYYNIQRESELQMTGRLRGGGKRGASTAARSGRKTDSNKEDVVAEMSLNIQRTLQSLSICTNPTLVRILTRINQMKGMCETHANIGRTLLAAFNTSQLQNLNLVSGGGNKDYKTILVW